MTGKLGRKQKDANLVQRTAPIEIVFQYQDARPIITTQPDESVLGNPIRNLSLHCNMPRAFRRQQCGDRLAMQALHLLRPAALDAAQEIACFGGSFLLPILVKPLGKENESCFACCEGGDKKLECIWPKKAKEQSGKMKAQSARWVVQTKSFGTLVSRFSILIGSTVFLNQSRSIAGNPQRRIIRPQAAHPGNAGTVLFFKAYQAHGSCPLLLFSVFFVFSSAFMHSSIHRRIDQLVF